MCLVTNSKWSSVAKEDIVCYKFLVMQDDTLLSPYFGFEYKLNTKYENRNKLDVKRNRNGGYIVSGGVYHSFKDLISAEHFAGFQTFFARVVNPIICVAECIIPKGTKYYTGEFDGYSSLASKNIIINKIVKYVPTH